MSSSSQFGNPTTTRRLKPVGALNSSQSGLRRKEVKVEGQQGREVVSKLIEPGEKNKDGPAGLALCAIETGVVLVLKIGAKFQSGNLSCFEAVLLGLNDGVLKGTPVGCSVGNSFVGLVEREGGHL